MKRLLFVAGLVMVLMVWNGCGSENPNNDTNDNADYDSIEFDDSYQHELPDSVDELPEFAESTADGDSAEQEIDATGEESISEYEIDTEDEEIEERDYDPELEFDQPNEMDEQEFDPLIEQDEEDAQQQEIYCESYEECPQNMVCNFALGRCEERASQIEWTEAKIFSFHPRSAAAGDILVIDGKRFYTSGFGIFAVQVFIGGVVAQPTGYSTDENRIAVFVPQGASGAIGIMCEGNIPVFATEELQVAQTGTIQCTGDTPMARGSAGATPTSTGKYAAGYIDLPDEKLRLFYPAQCGSLRRPAVAGTFPTILLLHGNGAGLINYEYIAELLATWGFITVMPATEHTNEYNSEVIEHIFSVYNQFRDKDLSSIHPALSGLHTSSDIAFIGHSRGCGRTDELFGDHGSEIAPHAKAFIFLGPAGAHSDFPGYVMVFGATEDGQSFSYEYNGAYNAASAPKWKIVIQGGNHSLFCDAKVYYGFDGIPTITRHKQHEIVMTYTLPLLQRAFGQDEPFGYILDNVPTDPAVQMESEQ